MGWTKKPRLKGVTQGVVELLGPVGRGAMGNTQGFALCICIGNLGNMPSSSTLLGLPVVSSSQLVIRGPATSQLGTLANLNDVVALRRQTLSLAATSMHSRSLHGGEEFASILQTGRADSLMGFY